jgi:anti-sigma regulatory factor (Ser/Thr protein kinase)
MCRLQTADYGPDPSAVRQARRWLVQRLDRWQISELADDAALLLTELVTNAIVHIDSQVHVVAAVADGVLEVGVTDHDAQSHLPRLPEAVPSQRGPDLLDGLRERGRGLALVALIADEWGVAPLETGKQVWFRLSVQPTWPHGPDCPCATEHLQRVRLNSGRHAVAVAGPWDEPPVQSQMA